MPRVDSAAETRRFKPLRPCGKTVPSFQGYSSARRRAGGRAGAEVPPLTCRGGGVAAATKELLRLLGTVLPPAHMSWKRGEPSLESTLGTV